MLQYENIKTNAKHEARKAIIDAMLAKKANGKKLTLADQIALVLIIVVSTLSDKLLDFYSISTSMWENHRCANRAKCPKSICSKCYVDRLKFRDSMVLSLLDNYLILNCFDISTKAWKMLTIPTVNGNSRIESHGDTDSVQCAVNYIRIVKAHKEIKFTAWTKNADHWAAALALEGKPRNLKLVWSSPNFNEVCLPPVMVNGNPFAQYVDHVFTVYDKATAKKLGITINCGRYDENYKRIDHQCRTCMRCYTGRKKAKQAEVEAYRAEIERLGLEYRGHDYYIFELKK